MKINESMYSDYQYKKQRAKTVLCVDKDQRVLQVMRRVLESLGYEVYTYSSITVVEQMASLIKADLLFLDINLVETNLRSVTLIAKNNPNLPTILVSGGSRDGFDDPSSRERFQGVLHKPFTTEMLINATHQSLEEFYCHS